MLHLDLFSGIGGFAIAAEHVWPDIEHIFCDNDPFCQSILKKHWPTSKIYGDIRTLTNTANTRIEEVRQGRQDEVFLLTGGFPCQPFSHAGRRKGTEDDRHLWPEMRRVIQEFSPRWVVGENVRGLLSIEGDWYSSRCALTWKLSATKSNRLLFQLVPSTPRTDVIESGLLLATPNTMDAMAPKTEKAVIREATETRKGRKKFANLRDQLYHGLMLPTPVANDDNKSPKAHLAMKARMKGGPRKTITSLQVAIKAHGAKTGLRLQPAFVEWMMGYPEGWTELND